MALPLKDEAIKIFLCSEGKADDVSQDMEDFLSYVAGKKTDNPFVRALDDAVEVVKEHEEWRQEYMTLLARDQDLIRQGKEEGREQGREEAIQNMIRYGVKKEVILRDYSVEEYEKAEQSLSALV